MNNMKNGFVLLARQLQYNKIWLKPASWLKVFIYILQEVNYEDKLFDRGENFFNTKDIAKSCHVKATSVREFIRWAKLTGLITTQKTTRGIIIKVVNYKVYQDIENYKNHTENHMKNQIETKQKPNRNHTIIKEINNINNKKNINNNKLLLIKEKESTNEKYKQIHEAYKKISPRCKLNKTIEKSINSVLQEISFEDILNTIEKYKDILESKECLYSHKFSFLKFIQQRNGLREFYEKDKADYIYNTFEKKIDNQLSNKNQNYDDWKQ